MAKKKDIHKILGGNILRAFEAVWGRADVKMNDPPAFHKDRR